jgi:hypothetical protein
VTREDPGLTSPEQRKRAYGHVDHVRQYGKDYAGKLRDAGLVVEVDGFVRTLSAEQILRHGLDRSEDVYFCTKPPAEPSGS